MTSPIKTIEQAQQREVIVGAAGADLNTALMPQRAQRAARHQIPLIAGYDPAAGLTLSIERREARASAGCHGRP